MKKCICLSLNKIPFRDFFYKNCEVFPWPRKNTNNTTRNVLSLPSKTIINKGIFIKCSQIANLETRRKNFQTKRKNFCSNLTFETKKTILIGKDCESSQDSLFPNKLRGKLCQKVDWEKTTMQQSKKCLFSSTKDSKLISRCKTISFYIISSNCRGQFVRRGRGWVSNHIWSITQPTRAKKLLPIREPRGVSDVIDRWIWFVVEHMSHRPVSSDFKSQHQDATMASQKDFNYRFLAE